MRFQYLILITSFILLLACGDTSVDIDKSTYQPKIVVNGLLYTGEETQSIEIMRNFPLNTTIIPDEKYISNALVTLRNQYGEIDTLNYWPRNRCYALVYDPMEIVGGEEYTLYVSAEIDGQELWTRSSTIAPYPGFSINDQLSTSGTITYRKYYVDGKLTDPTVTFNRTAGAEFYGLSAVALNANDSTFIEDNIFGFKPDSLQEVIDYAKHISYWSSPDNSADGSSTIDLPWYLIYFYSTYRLTIYAGDLNFYHFYISHQSVMNMDGNLREPLFHFEGDGIGLFGSAIRDSIFFEVIQ